MKDSTTAATSLFWRPVLLVISLIMSAFVILVIKLYDVSKFAVQSYNIFLSFGNFLSIFFSNHLKYW